MTIMEYEKLHEVSESQFDYGYEKYITLKQIFEAEGKCINETSLTDLTYAALAIKTDFERESKPNENDFEEGSVSPEKKVQRKSLKKKKKFQEVQDQNQSDDDTFVQEEEEFFQENKQKFTVSFLRKMNIPDDVQLENYIVIKDRWKAEYNDPIQVPYRAKNELPQAFIKIIPSNEIGTFQPPKNYLRGEYDDENMIEYDLESEDFEWLEMINLQHQILGRESISESQLEIVIDYLEKQYYENEKIRIQQSFENGEEKSLAICSVCLDGESEDTNDLLYCDKCHTPVHQACYGVVNVPEGNWSCQTCTLGLTNVSCMLCPNTGGVMKRTEDGLHWVHVNCALWIPETGFKNVLKMEPIHGVEEIPDDRWKLVCQVCRLTKGACIQCGVNTCTVAYHVSCAIADPTISMGIHERDGLVYNDIFCRRHSEKLKMEGNSSINHNKMKNQNIGGKKTKSKKVYVHVEFDASMILECLPEIQKQTQLEEETIQEIFEYWDLKRLKIRGKPLLRRIRVESETPHKFFNFRYPSHEPGTNRQLSKIRQQLDTIRNLLYLIMKREKNKKEKVEIIGDIFGQYTNILKSTLLTCFDKLCSITCISMETILSKPNSNMLEINSIEEMKKLICSNHFATLDNFEDFILQLLGFKSNNDKMEIDTNIEQSIDGSSNETKDVNMEKPKVQKDEVQHQKKLQENGHHDEQNQDQDEEGSENESDDENQVEDPKKVVTTIFQETRLSLKCSLFKSIRIFEKKKAQEERRSLKEQAKFITPKNTRTRVMRGNTENLTPKELRKQKIFDLIEEIKQFATRGSSSQDAYIDVESLKKKNDDGDYIENVLDLERDLVLLIDLALIETDSAEEKKGLEKLKRKALKTLSHFLLKNPEIIAELKQKEEIVVSARKVRQDVKKKEKTEELNGSILNEFNFPTHPQALLDYLIFFDYFGFFLVPVDVEEVTDYLTVVEEPIDFSLMQEKFQNGDYEDPSSNNQFDFAIDRFEKDFKLLIKNCLKYNADDSIYAQEAKRIQKEAEKVFQQFKNTIVVTSDEKKVRIKAVNNSLPMKSNLKLEKEEYLYIINQLRRYDWDGILTNEGKPHANAMIDLNLMNSKVVKGEYKNLGQLVTDFSLLLEKRNSLKKYPHKKQLQRIQTSATLLFHALIRLKKPTHKWTEKNQEKEEETNSSVEPSRRRSARFQKDEIRPQEEEKEEYEENENEEHEEIDTSPSQRVTRNAKTHTQAQVQTQKKEKEIQQSKSEVKETINAKEKEKEIENENENEDEDEEIEKMKRRQAKHESKLLKELSQLRIPHFFSTPDYATEDTNGETHSLRRTTRSQRPLSTPSQLKRKENEKEHTKVGNNKMNGIDMKKKLFAENLFGDSEPEDEFIGFEVSSTEDGSLSEEDQSESSHEVEGDDVQSENENENEKSESENQSDEIESELLSNRKRKGIENEKSPSPKRPKRIPNLNRH